MALWDHSEGSGSREDNEEVTCRFMVHAICMCMCGIHLDEEKGASGQGKMSPRAENQLIVKVFPGWDTQKARTLAGRDWGSDR